MLQINGQQRSNITENLNSAKSLFKPFNALEQVKNGKTGYQRLQGIMEMIASLTQ